MISNVTSYSKIMLHNYLTTQIIISIYTQTLKFIPPT